MRWFTRLVDARQAASLAGWTKSGNGSNGPAGGALDEIVAAADALRDARDYAGAAAGYAEALSYAAGRHDLRVQLANMLKDSGRFDEAEAQYRHVLRDCPEDFDARLQLGRVIKLRDGAGAAGRYFVELARASGADSCEPRTRMDIACDLQTLADQARDSLEPETAALLYRELVALNPDDTALRMQLGNMQKDSGRLEEALDTYTLVLERNPEHADAMLQLGRTWRLQGRLVDARNVLERARTLEPGSLDIEYELYQVAPMTRQPPAAKGARPQRQEEGDFRSRVERIAGSRVIGWAVDLSQPSNPLTIDAYIDGQFYAKVACEINRGDLSRMTPALRGGGFSLALPPGQGMASVSLRYRGRELRGSPVKAELHRVQDIGLLPAAVSRTMLSTGPERGIAVVVPVYNAPDEVASCIRSLIEHTTLPARIIVLDDASPDPRVSEILEAFSGYRDIQIVRNTENLGYTRNVNKGIGLGGDCDIVLLNSDTMVGPRWLEGLTLAARSRSNVATVTATSNAAGAFSVPRTDVDNAIPPGVPLADTQRHLTQQSLACWPDVPTGNGFCLYIRREALDAVGLFDEAAFPKGYGEENDWCMRAVRLGWTHVVDDRTFIYHTRSASFGASKTQLLADGRRVVDERFPEYKVMIRMFSDSRTLNAIRYNAGQALHRLGERASPADLDVRPRLLFCISTQSGGTPLTNKDLMTALLGKFEPWVLTSDANVIELYRFGPGTGVKGELVASRQLRDPISLSNHASLEYDQAVAEWMVRHAIELLHVRHLAWHSRNLPRIARALHIPTILSFHDYYAVCPSLKLLDEKLEFCGGRCTASAGECVPELWPAAEAPPLKNRWVHQWRALMEQSIKGCDAYVTTSHAAREILIKTFPFLDTERFRVIPHGRDFAEFRQPEDAFDANRPFRILVPGSISAAKGRNILEKLLELDTDRRLEFHVLGQLHPPIDGTRLVNHGTYARDDFAARATAIGADAGAIFSVWSETYCHTLTEMWALGLPVMAFDFGAVAERMGATGAGWILDHTDPAKLYRQICAIGEDAGERAQKLRAVANWQSTEGVTNTTRFMADQYASMYEGILANRRCLKPLTVQPIGAASATLRRWE